MGKRALCSEVRCLPRMQEGDAQPEMCASCSRCGRRPSMAGSGHPPPAFAAGTNHPRGRVGKAAGHRARDTGQRATGNGQRGNAATRQRGNAKSSHLELVIPTHCRIAPSAHRKSAWPPSHDAATRSSRELAAPHGVASIRSRHTQDGLRDLPARPLFLHSLHRHGERRATPSTHDSWPCRSAKKETARKIRAVRLSCRVPAIRPRTAPSSSSAHWPRPVGCARRRRRTRRPAPAA